MKLRFRTSILIIAVCLTAVYPSTLSAEYDYEYSARGNFEAEMGQKFSRGITNTFFGWMEMFHTPVHWGIQADRTVWSAVAIGIPYGVLRAVGRTMVGVYEMTTCFAPQGPIFYDLQGEVL